MAESTVIHVRDENINVPNSIKKNRFKGRGDSKPTNGDLRSSILTESTSTECEIVLDNKVKVNKEGLHCFLNDFVYLLENPGTGNVKVEWNEKDKYPFVFNLHSQVLTARSGWFRRQLKEKANLEDTIIGNAVIVNHYEVDLNKHLFKMQDGQKKKINDNTTNSVRHSTKVNKKSVKPSNTDIPEFAPIRLNDVQEFIKYLYTGDCSKVRLRNAQQLLLLASDFEVKSLQDRIYKYLESKLKSVQVDPEDVLSLIRLAYVCRIEKLKDLLRANMKDYRNIFRESEAWDILNDACGDQVFNDIKQDLLVNS